jgi:CHASE2 domain-containing sensor protein
MRLALAVLVAAAGALAAERADLLPRLEQDAVALRFQLRDLPPPPGIAVVAIDDVTFDEVEQWPLPRRIHAKAIDRLRRAGARVIVYDFQFTEPSGDDGADLALYDAVARARNVVLATTETDERGRTNVLGGDDNLAAAGARAGEAHLAPEPGGEINRFPYMTGGLESLAVAAAERATGRPVQAASFERGGAWIDYHGPGGTIPTYSLSRLVARTPDAGLLRALRDKIVIVGATAPTLQDVHATPADDQRLMAGPEIQANAISTILRGLPLRTAPGWLDALVILLLAALPALVSLRVRVMLAVAAVPLLGAGFLLAAQWAFADGLVLAVTYPVLGLVAGTVGMVVANYMAERVERRRVTDENVVLDRKVRERTRQLRETQLELLQRLGAAAESRDGETGAHIHRVSVMCERLALSTGMPREEAELLRHASPLHDVGKIGIPDRVLLKEGQLDDEERAVMQTHTTVGANILAGSHSPLVQLAQEVALTHHEKWDGSGYPNGLAGDAIPLSGRIVAICDVVDALLSRRPYKEPWPLERVLAELRALRGTHFDPELVDAFLSIAHEVRADLPFEAAPAPAAVPA